MTEQTAPAEEVVKIIIDASNLTFGDMETLWNGNLSRTDLVAFLDKIVVGGVRHIKYSQYNAIMAAIRAETARLENLGN